MIFDYGKLSAKHLAMILNEQLVRYGIDCKITRGIEYTLNEYGEIGDAEIVYPDELEPPESNNEIVTKVLLSAPTEGLVIDSNFISYADKLETIYQVTLKAELKYNDRLLITYPDGKWMTLKVTEINGYHPGSTVWFSGKAIITREPMDESHKRAVILGTEQPRTDDYGDPA